MIMAEGIRKAGNNFTGKGVKEGLETLSNFQTGGITIPVSFSPTNHKGSTGIKILLADPDKMSFKAITGWITP